jgi:hypothetical protein
MGRCYSGGFTTVLNFQIRLYEVDNKIEVLYRDFVAPVTGNVTGQVGLRGADNTFATNVNNRMTNGANFKFVPSAAGSANNSGFVTRLLGGNIWVPIRELSLYGRRVLILPVWLPTYKETTSP